MSDASRLPLPFIFGMLGIFIGWVFGLSTGALFVVGFIIGAAIALVVAYQRAESQQGAQENLIAPLWTVPSATPATTAPTSSATVPESHQLQAAAVTRGTEVSHG